MSVSNSWADQDEEYDDEPFEVKNTMHPDRLAQFNHFNHTETTNNKPRVVNPIRTYPQSQHHHSTPRHDVSKPYPCRRCQRPKLRDARGWYCPCEEKTCKNCGVFIQGRVFLCDTCFNMEKKNRMYLPRHYPCKKCKRPQHEDHYCEICDKHNIYPCDWSEGCHRKTNKGTPEVTHYCWLHWKKVQHRYPTTSLRNKLEE